MKVNKQCVNCMCGLFLVILLGFFTSCTKPASEVMLTEVYPELYEAVYERDTERILSFTDHEWEAVRAQAWRALINTPVDDLDGFIERVKEVNTEEAWMALSTKELSNEQLLDLSNSWNRKISLRDGINRVLGQQGNEESLKFLVRNFDYIIFSTHEFSAALAIGRLIGKYSADGINEDMVIRHAAIQENPDIVKAYLYGYYRHGKVIKDERSQQIIWESFLYAADPEIKQYMLKIAFQNDAQHVLENLDVNSIEQMNVQLAIELAQLIGQENWSNRLQNIYERLLQHENPVVNEAALNQLYNHPDKPKDFDEVINSQIISNKEKRNAVRLSGIQALSQPESFKALADSLTENNVYFLSKKLKIYQEILSNKEFLDLLEEYIQSENRKEVLFAVQSLSDWWSSISSQQKNTVEERVRTLLFDALAKRDRSITYSTGALLKSPEILRDEDYQQLKSFLSSFNLPEDVEVFQVVSDVFKSRFEEQAKPYIDSLAAEGNVALNQALENQGWDIPDTEKSTQNFLEADWERLLELGYNPHWVLETEQGNIVIEMDVLAAPVTISGMDSLTMAGAYDNVPFHRVVPNFVVQGGDVETGDGFGGPNYVVPTEASEKQFERSMVGIASAGRDTEGSQYFLMHQWKPHLNGRYTIVGKVIEGMDVVDKIMVGDRVTRAYWLNSEK